MSAKKETTIQERLKKLKQARSKSVLDNKRVVYNEAAGIKQSLIEKRKLEDLKDKEEETNDIFVNNSDNNKKNENIPVDLSALEYTAEEDEKWEAKQDRIKSHNNVSDSKHGQLHNYKKLAERTYTKKIRLIEANGKKSIEDYQKEKETYDKLKAKGLSEEEIRSRTTSSKNLDTYVEGVKEWENEVSKKRRKVTDEGKDGAIHEKNRQFNSKLERHYRQFKK